MVDGEGDGCVRAGAKDFYYEDGIIVFPRPGRHLCGIAAVIFDKIFRKIIEQNMFPGDEDGGILVRRFLKFTFKALNLLIAKFSVNGQPAADCGGFNGCKRTNVIVTARINFLGGIRGKYKLRSAEFFQQHVGQCQSTVKPATSKLAQATGRFFAVPDADEGFHGLVGKIGLRAKGNGHQ